MTLNGFDRFKVSAVHQRESTPDPVNGVPQPKTWSTLTPKKILLWETSSAKALVSDRFMEQVSSLAAIDPGVDIQTGDRLTIASRVYDVIHPDNVGTAGEYQLVGLKEFDNGAAS